jgi:hypothetical protein
VYLILHGVGDRLRVLVLGDKRNRPSEVAGTVVSSQG